MFKKCVLCLFLALVSSVDAQDASNLWLFEVTDSSPATILKSRKITDNPTYSNQPHFTKDTKHLYFTQAFSIADSQQMDSMQMELDTGKIKNLTQSQVSEYSPTPYKNGFSTILVDDAGKQWLWAFDGTGKSIGRLSNVEPIGYHVWLDKTNVLAFVLGEPHTLQRIQLVGEAHIVDSDIGPSLWAIPNSARFSYSKSVGRKTALMAYEPENGEIENIAFLPEQATYYAWHPNGYPISGDGSKILRLLAQGAEQEWVDWLDLTEFCNSISRLHAQQSIKGTQVAVICVDNIK